MENISYGTDGSKILELHKTGRTDLLNLPSICISLFIKNLSTVTAPHTLGCEIVPRLDTTVVQKPQIYA